MINQCLKKYSGLILIGFIVGLTDINSLHQCYSQEQQLSQINETNESNHSQFQELPLEECIEIALQSNHRIGMSKYAVLIAEAQHQEALSGYWPQFTFKAGYQRTDEPPNYIFPSSVFQFPGSVIQIPPGSTTVTIPENAFAPGFPSSSVDLPIQTVESGLQIPAQTFRIPDQKILLREVDTYSTSLELQWLLYDGGWRKSLRQQSQSGINIEQEKAKQTELEIIDLVKRYYYAHVLAIQLLQVGIDTLARMEATLRLTESLYQAGSGKVKKTDFLDNKIVVESVRSTVALLEQNKELTRAALINIMGLPWDAHITLSAKDIPYNPQELKIEPLMTQAFRFSPNWAQMLEAIQVAQGTIGEMESKRLPRVAVKGSLDYWWNDLETGYATDENKKSWQIGIGMEFPLFTGFRTSAKIRGAEMLLEQRKEQQMLLEKGIALQIQDIFFSLDAAQKRYNAIEAAKEAAIENRDLNTRAYQHEIVETEDVVQAQLMEALMIAQHLRLRYEHVALHSRLHLVVGTEVVEKIFNEMEIE